MPSCQLCICQTLTCLTAHCSNQITITLMTMRITWVIIKLVITKSDKRQQPPNGINRLHYTQCGGGSQPCVHKLLFGVCFLMMVECLLTNATTCSITVWSGINHQNHTLGQNLLSAMKKLNDRYIYIIVVFRNFYII